MTIFRKIKSVLSILVVFILVIATNLIDRSSFNKVRDAVENIYEDRLIAKDIINKFSNNLYEIEIAYHKANVLEPFIVDSSLVESLRQQLSAFKSTTLTAEESIELKSFEKELQVIVDSHRFNETFSDENKTSAYFVNLKEHISTLSEIQMKEGHKLVYNAQKEFDLVDLFTKLEIFFLIFLAILIQIVILYKPKKAITEELD